LPRRALSAENVRRLLADTSVLIDPPTEAEVERHELEDAEQAISVVSIAELHMGTLTSEDPDERAQRLRRLTTVEARHEPLPVDSAVARVLGRYMAETKRARHALRTRDAIIATTAEANGLAVLTRDNDFQRFGAELLLLRGAGPDR